MVTTDIKERVSNRIVCRNLLVLSVLLIFLAVPVQVGVADGILDEPFEFGNVSEVLGNVSDEEVVLPDVNISFDNISSDNESALPDINQSINESDNITNLGIEEELPDNQSIAVLEINESLNETPEKSFSETNFGIAAADSYEDDDSYQNASWITVETIKQEHTIDPAGDVDYIKFNATNGKRYEISTNDLANNADTMIYLYDQDGTSQLAYNDDVASGVIRRSMIIWDADATGTYFVRVIDFDSGLSGGVYNISIEEKNISMMNVSIVEPSSGFLAGKGDVFNFTINLTCNSFDCNEVTTYLDPEEKGKETLREQGIGKIGADIRTSIRSIDSDDELDVIIVLSDDPIEESEKYSKKINMFSAKSDEALGGLQKRNADISYRQEKILSKLGGSSERYGVKSTSTKKFELKRQYSTINALSGKITKDGLEALKDDASVKSVYVDYDVSVELDESIPLINADDVWGTQVGGVNITGAGQTVCVIDTGINYNHSDFGGANGFPSSKVVGGYDYVNDDADPWDDHGHGSHCAGIVASEDSQFKGVSPDAKLVAIKVLDGGGSGSTSDVMAGIDWCINNADDLNITVISMSLGCEGGGCTHYQSYCDLVDGAAGAIAYANSVGIAVAVASGNDGWSDGVSAPSCSSGAITVGSVSKSDTPAGSSNMGVLQDLFAPGVSIEATSYSGGHTLKSGTSMATPHVAGAIVLFNQYYERRFGIMPTPDTTKERLASTGPEISDHGLTRKRLDIEAALFKGVIPMNSGTPFFTTTQNPNATNISAGESVLITWEVNATGDSNSTWEFFTFSALDATDEEYRSERINITINSLPVISEVNITPDPAYNDDLLNCTGTFTDADGNAETSSSWKWFNQSGVIAGQTGQTLNFSYFDTGDSIICEYTPGDDYGVGVPVNSSQLTISNRAPNITAVTIVPSTAYTNDTLNCSGIYSDLDFDVEFGSSWKWFNDLGIIAGESGQTLGSGNFSKGDNTTCEYTPSDGNINGTSVNSSSVQIQNLAPSLSSIPFQSTAEDNSAEVDLSAYISDVDGDLTSIILIDENVSQVNCTESGNNMSVDPAQDWFGVANCTLRVTDGELNSSDQVLYINVTSVNDEPIIDTSAITSAVEDTPYIYDVNASDVENDALTYALETSPDGMIINSSTGLMTWTANNTQVGNENVNITVSDGNGGSDSQNFTITITNNLPTFTSTDNLAATEDSLYTYDVNATDEGEGAFYTLINGSGDMAINTTIGIISWTPLNGEVGSVDVNMSINDTNGGVVFKNFTVVVSNTNDAPTFSSDIDNVSITEDTSDFSINLSAHFSDVDVGDSLVYDYSAINNISIIIDNVTGIVNITPDPDFNGVRYTTFTAIDTSSASVDSNQIKITVTGVNDAPTLSVLPDQVIVEESEGSIILSTYSDDVDGDSLSYEVIGENTSAVNCGMGSDNLTFTGATDFAGTANCTIIAKDAFLNSTAQTIVINVTNINDVPTATISAPGNNSQIVNGTNITFSGSGSDVEDGVLSGDGLVWTSSLDGNFANGTNVNINSSLLSVGNHTIMLNVTDSSSASDWDYVSIEIMDSGSSNLAPVANITAPSSGSSFLNGTQINFTGTGVDNEDGALSGDSLVWTSDVDGNFGNGTSVNISSLSEGDHVMTLTVTDSGNLTDNDIITLSITVPSDSDGDGTPDDTDTLEGDSDDVSTSGVSNLGLEINGSSTVNGIVFEGELVVTLSDGSTDLADFSYNFSEGTLNMSKITIDMNDSGIVFDLGGQQQAGYSKTLYLTDHDFTGLCVEDVPITTLTDITDTCIGANEYDLTACIGNSTGYQSAHITCYDEGSRFRFENLSYSGVVGTGGDFSTPNPPSGGGGGGGGGGMSTTTDIVPTPEGDLYEFRRGDAFNLIVGSTSTPFRVYGTSGVNVKLSSDVVESIYLYPGDDASLDLDVDGVDETRIMLLVAANTGKYTLLFEKSVEPVVIDMVILPPKEWVPRDVVVPEDVSDEVEDISDVSEDVSEEIITANAVIEGHSAGSSVQWKTVLKWVVIGIVDVSVLLLAIISLFRYFRRKRREARFKEYIVV